MKNKDFSAILAADKARALHLTPVSRETEDRLDRLISLLTNWQNSINLIAPSTLSTLWTRHVADSLQLLPLAGQPKLWIDLGSGGGFPGIVVACAVGDGASVHLVESNQKKASFLREAARETGTPAQVHAKRIEDFADAFSGEPDIVSARALAPLRDLLGLSYPLLKTGATGLFPKGQDVDAELTEASKYWKFAHELVPSLTSPDGKIVVVRDLSKRP